MPRPNAALLLPALLAFACTGSDDIATQRHAASSLLLFDNGDPSGGFGVTILSERDSFNQVGDDFSLAGPVVVDRLDWWGDGDGDDFSVRVFEVVAGVPQPLPIYDIDLGTVVGSEESFPGGEHFLYQAELPDVEIGPGTYVLSIVENHGGDETRWFWSASCEDGCEDHSFRRLTDGNAWSVGNWDFAFRLYGSYVGKIELCHCVGKTFTACKTLELPSPAIAAHLEHHPGDFVGSCGP